MIAFFMGLGLFFCGCEKDIDGSGFLTVTVKYKGNPIQGAELYIKKGTLLDPGIPLDRYDIRGTTSSDGRFTLNGAMPGIYFLHAKVYISNEGRYAEGNDSVTVRQRFRQNFYELIVEAH